MDASPFAILPAELRNHIWTYALQASFPIRFRAKETLIPPHAQIPLKDMFALTETCRAIRRETRLIFFNINVFAFHGILNYLDKDFNTFISSIDADGQDALGSLFFEVYDLLVGGDNLGTVSQAFRPEVVHALHRFRLFALEHPGCDCWLRYRPVPVFGKVSIDLRNISTSSTAVIAELRDLAVETRRHKKEVEFVVRVVKRWRDVLGQNFQSDKDLSTQAGRVTMAAPRAGDVAKADLYPSQRSNVRSGTADRKSPTRWRDQELARRYGQIVQFFRKRH